MRRPGWWLAAAVFVALFVTLAIMVPPRPAPKKPAPAPDQFRILGTWPLSSTETVRLIHVPDALTGLRCLIYQNPQQTVVHCDDDLPR